MVDQVLCNDVIVLDANGKKINCTNCANARRLLKNGKAKKVLTTPFTIRLLNFKLYEKKAKDA